MTTIKSQILEIDSVSYQNESDVDRKVNKKKPAGHSGKSILGLLKITSI